MILLDTNIWVWINLAPERLPDGLGDQLRQSELALSPISIWEARLAVEKGRIHSNLDPEPTVRTWLAANYYTILPLDAEIALLSRSLHFGHDDPGDRFIAATAIRHQVPLATSDARLRNLPWLQVLPERGETELNAMA